MARVVEGVTRRTSDLARPAPIAAAIVLAVNDHVLKGAGLLPGWLTGKLSDVAGLFAATILAVTVARAVASAVAGRAVSRTGATASVAALLVAGGFAALKLWPELNAAVEAVWGVNRLDPTDLFALPAVALAWLWLRDRQRTARGRSSRQLAGGLAFAGVALACVATSAPPPVPPRPVAGWAVRDANVALPCGEATAWVAKSGKTGFGLTVRVTATGEQPCELSIASADARFPDATVVTGRELEIVQPTEPAHYHYVAFAFDNNERWNSGQRTAQVELELSAGGQAVEWVMPATHGIIQFGVGER